MVEYLKLEIDESPGRLINPLFGISRSFTTVFITLPHIIPTQIDPTLTSDFHLFYTSPWMRTHISTERRIQCIETCMNYKVAPRKNPPKP